MLGRLDFEMFQMFQISQKLSIQGSRRVSSFMPYHLWLWLLVSSIDMIENTASNYWFKCRKYDWPRQHLIRCELGLGWQSRTNQINIQTEKVDSYSNRN